MRRALARSPASVVAAPNQAEPALPSPALTGNLSRRGGEASSTRPTALVFAQSAKEKNVFERDGDMEHLERPSLDLTPNHLRKMIAAVPREHRRLFDVRTN